MKVADKKDLIMTEDEFWCIATRVGERFVSKPSNTATEMNFRAEISLLVDSLYASGGFLLDRSKAPIFDRGDVELITHLAPHSISLTAVRRSNLITFPTEKEN